MPLHLTSSLCRLSASYHAPFSMLALPAFLVILTIGNIEGLS